MFDIWNVKLGLVFKHLGNSQKVDNVVGLLGESLVDFEAVSRIDLGHFKVVF